MKKYIVYITCFFSLSISAVWEGAFAQVNLVPNYSFEDTVHCPNQFAQIGNALHWSGLGSSDYFNSCAPGIYVSVPINGGGYQLAKTGNAYAGFYTYFALGSNIREYVQAKLDSVLRPLHKYCAEFYVNLADTQKIACNNVGIYFSDTIVTSSYPPFNLIPQITNDINNNPLTNKIGWTKVSGSFIATGGEQYITIGSFVNDANSDTVMLHTGTGDQINTYYYIDDVSIVDCTGVGVSDILEDEGISIYPNPATATLTIETKTQNTKIEIINFLSQIVYSSTMNNPTFTIDISTLPKGVYFVKLQNTKQSSCRKFVKE